MRKVNAKIWGRSLKLSVVFDCYGRETVSEVQEQAFKEVLSDERIIDSSLEKVKKYCLEDEKMGGKKSIDNVFKYVIPKTLYIIRSKRSRKVALLCDYKYDSEHGLAVMFENGKCKDVISQAIL